MEAKVLIRR